jgi:hypothetical protein
MFKIVAGNKIEVEAKDEMKERIRKSPDLYDWFAVGTEGARRLGFKIQRLGMELDLNKPDNNFFGKRSKSYQKLLESKMLQSV